MVTKKQLKAQLNKNADTMVKALNVIEDQKKEIDDLKEKLNKHQNFMGLMAVNILIREINEGHVKL
jgi:chaperonin cofactor prefoldin